MGGLTVVLCLLVIITAFFLLLLRNLLRPIVPVKGVTNVPGPIGGITWPIFGNALWFARVRDVKGMYDVLQTLIRMRKSIISFLMGSKLVILVYDAILLKKIIDSKKCTRKEEEFYSQFACLGDGVFSTTNIPRWSNMRRWLDKFLHPKLMDDFLVTFVNKAEMACDKIQRIYDQGIFNVLEVVQFCTLDIVLELFMGIPGTQQLENTMNIPELLGKCVPCALLRMINPLYKINWIFQSSAVGRDSKEFKDGIRPLLRRIVDDCLRKMEARGYDQNDPNFEPQNYLEAVIHIGLQEGNVSHDKLLFSFCDFIIAGFDTTSVAISSTILYLAMHPEYQEKAYQEQLRIMGNKMEPPTRAEVSKMEYLEMTFLETLRKVSVPAVVKTVSSQLELDGYVVPEGCSLYLWYNVIANDSRYWEKPNDYYPDHFLPENIAKRPECSFTPFSFGTRGCPGRKFGILSSKVILSMLLRKFKFITPLHYDDITFKLEIMLIIEQGYPVEATPRVAATT